MAQILCGFDYAECRPRATGKAKRRDGVPRCPVLPVSPLWFT